jgi:hypothetical protein
MPDGIKSGGTTVSSFGNDKGPNGKWHKRKRNRPGNFANYGKPSFPAAKAYPFEWGRVYGS